MKKRLPALAALAVLLVAVGAAAHWRSAAPFGLGSQVAAAAQPGDIYMYSATTCGYCKKAARWFRAHDIPFEQCEIDRDAACKARFYALKAPGTPVMLVRGEKQVGFNPSRLAAALGVAQ